MRRIRIIDKDHLRKVRALPCIACEIAGVQQVSPTSAHHIKREADGSLLGASQKAHDTETIPLCCTCHWNGHESIWTHRGFEAEFGDERALLAATLKRIEEMDHDAT